MTRSGAIATVRMAHKAAGPEGTLLDGKFWPPLISKRPSHGADFMDTEGNLTASSTRRGTIEFRLGEVFENEEWSTYIWNNAEATIWIGEHGKPFSEYTQYFAGRVSALGREGFTASLDLIGPEAVLDTDFLTEKYAGTGGAEKTRDEEGSLKPWCSGYALSVDPELVDQTYWVYQVHGYGPIQDIPAVYERAEALDPTRMKASVSSYAELISLSLLPSEWAVCLPQGMFRLGGAPRNKNSADVRGAKNGSTKPLTLDEIVPHLLQQCGVPANRIGDFSAFAGVTWNTYVTGQVNAGDLLRDALAQAGGALLCDSYGVFFGVDCYTMGNPLPLSADRSTTPLVRPGSITQLKNADPVNEVTVGYDRCWAPHSSSDVSPAFDNAIASIENDAQEIREEYEETKADVTIQLNRLDAMTSDGVLDRAEKKYWVQEYTVQTGEFNELDARADSYAITVERADLQNAFSALTDYLNSLSPAFTASKDTPVSRTTYRTKWNDFYQAKIKLLNKLLGLGNLYSTLTNDSTVLFANASGVISDFSPARGTMSVTDGNTLVSSGVTYSVVAATGLTISITSAGLYSVTAMSTNAGTAILRAVYNGQTFDKVFSVAKAVTGATGATGPKGDSGTAGDTGADGTPAISGFLTNESVTLQAYASGIVADYAPATGQFVVMSGTTDVSTNFALSSYRNPTSLTVSYNGQTYSVSGGFAASTDTAELTIRATGSGQFSGITLDRVFSIAKSKAGYEILGSLPTTNLFAGRMVFLTTDNKLYRYTGSEWTAAVATSDLSGTIASAQIDTALTNAVQQHGYDISDLTETYGSTVSAAQSALDASEFRDAAETARDEATIAKTAAETAKGLAQTAQTQAATSATNALGSANSAASSSAVAAQSAKTALYLDVGYVADFSNNATDGWGGSNATVTPGPTGLTLESNLGSNDPILARVGLTLNGGKYLRVVVEVTRTANRTSGGWDGRMFWTTAGHGWDGTYGAYNTSAVSDPKLNERVQLVFDLTQASATAFADWSGNAITGLRFDFDQGQGGAFIVHSIRVVGPDSLAPSKAASAAASSAQTAGTKATEASQSASAASTSATNASTSAGNASTSASQASSSASDALGSKNAAATSAGAAATSATNAGDSAEAASTSAQTATTKANEAGASASSASNSATVAASIAAGLMNPNPMFADWVSGTALPARWADWANATANISKSTGEVSANAVRLVAPATKDCGLHQVNANMPTSLLPGDWVVIEADIKLNSGSLVGAGVLLRGTSTADARITFASDSDTKGNTVGAGVAGTAYRFRKLIQITAGSNAAALYLMSHWSVFGSIAASNDITWYRCGWRFASSAEIKTGQIDTLSASVSTQSGAIATLQGKTAAYWNVTANAGTSNAVISARADGAGTSNVTMAANKIVLANTSGSTVYDALVIENGNATFAGALRAGSVSANNLAVGTGGNLLVGTAPGMDPNDTLYLSYNPGGVSYSTNGTAGRYILSPNYGSSWPSSDWTLPDNSSFAIYQPNYYSGSATYSDFYFRSPINASGATASIYAAQAGKTYEFSLYTGVHRCNGSIYLRFVDANNNTISYSGGSSNNQEQNGGTTLAGYKRLVTRAVAPSGTVAVCCMVRKGHTLSGNTDSWFFMARPQLTEVGAYVTDPTPWVAPGGTFINGSSIITKSITADHIAVGAITANELGAGAVTAAKIGVTDLSSITANIGTLTAGTIRNASDTYRVDVTNGRTIARTGSWMKVTGAPFGSSNQFLEWYGPYSSNLAACTEANASYYLSTDGSAYFGGTLSAGVLKNSAQTTNTASNASVSIGPYGTNGSAINVVLSYYCRSGYTNTYAATTAGRSDWNSAVSSWGATATNGTVSASKSVSCNVVIRLDRVIGSTTTTGWQTLTITSCSETMVGTAPIPNDAEGNLSVTRTVQATLTATDNTGGTSNRTLTATLVDTTNRSNGTVSAQTVGIVSTEQ